MLLLLSQVRWWRVLLRWGIVCWKEPMLSRKVHPCALLGTVFDLLVINILHYFNVLCR